MSDSEGPNSAGSRQCSRVLRDCVPMRWAVTCHYGLIGFKAVVGSSLCRILVTIVDALLGVPLADEASRLAAAAVVFFAAAGVGGRLWIVPINAKSSFWRVISMACLCDSLL